MLAHYNNLFLTMKENCQDLHRNVFYFDHLLFFCKDDPRRERFLLVNIPPGETCESVAHNEKMNFQNVAPARAIMDSVEDKEL